MAFHSPTFLVVVMATMQTFAVAATAPEGASSPTNYGVLAQTVAAAGTLIAAAGALALTWKGRYGWEPAEEDIPRAAQKFGGLIIAIIIAAMWFKFARQQVLGVDDLFDLAIIFALVGFFGLVVYGLLVGVLVYEKVVALPGNATDVTKVIGGYWLTAAAREALVSGDPRPHSVADVFKGAAYDPDHVWPRISRALAKVSFQIAYILLVAGGTCALSAVALLVASAAA